MLKLWGRANSINVQKVVWCLEELRLPYERIEAGLAFGVNHTPEYLAMNPNGLVPTLKDGDLVMWESNSIVRYLAATYDAGGLWPADPGQRARADRWCDWQLSVFNPAFGDAFHGLVRSPGSRTPEQIAASQTKSRAAMQILDHHLADNTFLAGDRLSFGDIVLGSSVHRWLHMPVERQSTPHASRWYEMLAARPATEKAFLLPLD
jgi:glutathione S-transferase